MCKMLAVLCGYCVPCVNISKRQMFRSRPKFIAHNFHNKSFNVIDSHRIYNVLVSSDFSRAELCVHAEPIVRYE